ncbi:hypothetical protein QF046_001973 [Microbacterium sp. W4I4]|uniref:hypothetical protein n=1 Tax=Microbacterium sp. W4I4 TaxID=3042295 RepID=UPI002787D430|nr:hypothetical protein [Microbacterium sp. W4I4]MDQ0614332.1 hypothetical protein [Microbacterium sp. W4I4]
MYANPYLVARVNQAELERQTVLLERMRIAREQPERLVPRRRGRMPRVLRMLRHVVPVRRRRTVEA